MDISTDHSTGTKFGDLKKEERFKRLERDLRLEFVKHMERIKADLNKEPCTSPTWPSLSSINPDNLDTSAAIGPSLQVSRVESEVIASSSNLQKVFPMPKYFERAPMATSSVKHFPIKTYDKDRAIMPPPSTSNFPFTGAKRFSAQDAKQNEQIKAHDSSMKMSSAASCSSYQEELNSSENMEHSRSFTRWRVLLNTQGQLIIKGTLECGKIARSKPIIHRLSSSKVQSIYKHIYVLIGPIVDEKDELPDYVRDKFHNGFPDDWENVYQIWTSYIAEGCKGTFRWPTPVTDSDDDLYSEITDFSYLKNRPMEYREQQLKMITNNGSSLGYHSRTQSDSNLNVEKPQEDKINSLNHSKPQVDNKSIEDSGNSSEMRDSNACSNEHGVKNNTADSHNNSSNFSNSNLRSASFLSQIIKEEKLRIIMSNLGDRNCPPQYLDKLIELSDCLRFILSYNPDNCTTDCKKQDLSDSKSQSQICEKCNHSTISLVESSQEDSLMKQKKQNECVKTDGVNKSPTKLNDQPAHTPVTTYSKQTNSHHEATHSSSDSDGCMGVPHIPVDRLIQPKSPRHQRYRDRRNRNRERNDVNKDAQVESQMVPVSNARALAHDDSSVSVTEDEFERRRHEMRNYQFKEPFLKGNQEQSSKIRRVPSFNENENENVNTINHQLNLPSTSNKSDNLAEKSKPVIKSCEKTHYKLTSLQKVKKPTPIPPDVTILSEDVTMKIKDHVTPKNKNQKESTGGNSEKLQKDILKHPFLSYDSEDYFNEKEANMQIELPPSMSLNKTKDKKSSSFEKSKEIPDDLSAKQEHLKKAKTDHSTSLEPQKSATIKTKSEPFGSKNNPKLLTSWVPCVKYDKTNDKLSLKFEGKILNERGHVLHRKFTTDSILKRHSSKLIETDKNEFFSLVGELSDTKHVVPKELLKQCTTGCPTKLKEFCENWKKLSLAIGEPLKPDNLLDASIDHLNMPTSKRGRTIVPTLNYWEGERLVKKHGVVVYDPGNKMESSLTSKADSVKKEPSSEVRQRSKSNKDVNAKGSMSSKSSKPKESLPQTEGKRSPQKKRLVQQLTYSSEESGDDSDEPKKFRKLSGDSRPCPVGKLPPKHSTRQNAKLEDHEKIRKTNKTNHPQSKTRSSRPACQWSYEKDQSYPDLLSDDQVSVMNENESQCT